MCGTSTSGRWLSISCLSAPFDYFACPYHIAVVALAILVPETRFKRKFSVSAGYISIATITKENNNGATTLTDVINGRETTISHHQADGSVQPGSVVSAVCEYCEIPLLAME